MSYFPDTDEDAVRRAISAVLGVKPGYINTSLVDHGDELNFHIATNPDFLATLLAAAGRKRLSRSVMRQAFSKNTVFQSSASSALRKQLAEARR